MDSVAQQQTWLDLYADVELAALQQNAETPDEFQLELKAVIDALHKPGARIVEVGCATGVTSLILDDRFAKTLLDMNPRAIALAESLFRAAGKHARFTVASLFVELHRNLTRDLRRILTHPG